MAYTVPSGLKQTRPVSSCPPSWSAAPLTPTVTGRITKRSGIVPASTRGKTIGPGLYEFAVEGSSMNTRVVALKVPK